MSAEEVRPEEAADASSGPRHFWQWAAGWLPPHFAQMCLRPRGHGFSWHLPALKRSQVSLAVFLRLPGGLPAPLLPPLGGLACDPAPLP